MKDGQTQGTHPVVLPERQPVRVEQVVAAAVPEVAEVG